MQERRVEQHEIESLARDRREQVAVPNVDALLEMVQHRIEARAAHGGRIDVDGDDTACVARREQARRRRSPCPCRAPPRPGEIEPRVDLRREERAGAQHLRIRHARNHEDGHVEHALEAEAVVTIVPGEPVGEPEQPAGERAQRPGRSSASSDGIDASSMSAAPSRKASAVSASGSRHIEHTHFAHSGRSPARISARSARAGSLARLATIFGARGASVGGGMKKHGATRPSAPTTAENSGALQRTGGNAPSPSSAAK